jgi:peptidoglycan/LPS O-acetylase OafA/YrhL
VAAFDRAFDPRRNSLNFIRLVLAVAVLLDHSGPLGGFANGANHFFQVAFRAVNPVYGFFGISGYLIAASAGRNRTGRFLWQRFLRIFPAFWVCLIVTSFGFGLVGWYYSNSLAVTHCGLYCYAMEPNGPLGFIFHNSWLRIN